MYALHVAAASLAPKAVDAVRWLLEKGIPWSVQWTGKAVCRRSGRRWGNEYPGILDRLEELGDRISVTRHLHIAVGGFKLTIPTEYELYYRSNREPGDQPRRWQHLSGAF
jgi:hypothetical protein